MHDAHGAPGEMPDVGTALNSVQTDILTALLRLSLIEEELLPNESHELRRLLGEANSKIQTLRASRQPADNVMRMKVVRNSPV